MNTVFQEMRLTELATLIHQSELDEIKARRDMLDPATERDADLAAMAVAVAQATRQVAMREYFTISEFVRGARGAREAA